MPIFTLETTFNNNGSKVKSSVVKFIQRINWFDFSFYEWNEKKYIFSKNWETTKPKR